MTTDVAEHQAESTHPAAGGAAGPDADLGAGAMGRAGATGPISAGGRGDTARTGTEAPEAAQRIIDIRERIDEIDATLIALWQERAALSQQVGATRIASGGTRLVLSREREILEKFRTALGADGTQLALLLLRAGRGPL